MARFALLLTLAFYAGTTVAAGSPPVFVPYVEYAKWSLEKKSAYIQEIRAAWTNYAQSESPLLAAAPAWAEWFLPMAEADGPQLCVIGSWRQEMEHGYCSTRHHPCDKDKEGNPPKDDKGNPITDSFNCGPIYADKCIWRTPVKDLTLRCYHEVQSHPMEALSDEAYGQIREKVESAVKGCEDKTLSRHFRDGCKQMLQRLGANYKEKSATGPLPAQTTPPTTAPGDVAPKPEPRRAAMTPSTSGTHEGSLRPTPAVARSEGALSPTSAVDRGEGAASVIPVVATFRPPMLPTPGDPTTALYSRKIGGRYLFDIVKDYTLKDSHGRDIHIPEQAIRNAFDFYDKYHCANHDYKLWGITNRGYTDLINPYFNQPVISNSRFMFITDMTKDRGTKRFHKIDLLTGEIDSTFVAHGMASDCGAGMPPCRFGSSPTTGLTYTRSPAGFFAIGPSGIDQKTPVVQTIGLEDNAYGPSSGNAIADGIVIHSGGGRPEYMSDVTGPQGNSHGCPAMAPQAFQRWQKDFIPGSLSYIYTDQLPSHEPRVHGLTAGNSCGQGTRVMEASAGSRVVD